MKKLFLSSGLFALLFSLAFSGNVYAKKKYRYIKRMHGAKIHWDTTLFKKTAAGNVGTFDIDLAYSYNWKGMIEVGPYLGLKGKHIGFALEGLDAGLSVEYNFIKNKGKKKIVPSLGLQIGTQKAAAWELALAVPASLKYFVAKRTALIATLGYRASNSFSALTNFQSMSHDIFFVGGFAYYFDIY